MARISGIDLPRDKRIEVALTYIYGIGPARAAKVLEVTGIDPDIRVKDLTEEQEAKLRDAIEQLDNGSRAGGKLHAFTQRGIAGDQTRFLDDIERTPLGQEHIRLRIQLQPGAELAGRFSGSFRNCPNLRAILRKQGQDKIRLPQLGLSQHEHAGVVGALRHELFERYRRDIVRGVEGYGTRYLFRIPRDRYGLPQNRYRL